MFYYVDYATARRQDDVATLEKIAEWSADRKAKGLPDEKTHLWKYYFNARPDEIPIRMKDYDPQPTLSDEEAALIYWLKVMCSDDERIHAAETIAETALVLIENGRNVATFLWIDENDPRFTKEAWQVYLEDVIHRGVAWMRDNNVVDFQKHKWNTIDNIETYYTPIYWPKDQN